MKPSSRRLLLIDPPMVKHPLWDPIRTSQPLGIWSIASYVRSQGHEAEVICAPLEGLDRIEDVETSLVSTLDQTLRRRLSLLPTNSTDSIVDSWISSKSELRVGIAMEDILTKIAAYRPDAIGISATASCMHQSVTDLAIRIRARYPDVVILVGGQHATAMTSELLRDSKGAIDLVVTGEGEFTTHWILEALPDIEKARSLDGVAYLDKGLLRRGAKVPWQDLAALPSLDPRLLDHIHLPMLPVHTYGCQGQPKYTDMMFSVGCHRKCPYCFSPTMRGRLRRQSEDQIHQQLRRLAEAGYGEIILQDDDLLMDKKHFLSLLRAIREHGFSWQDNGGMELELLDDELVSAIIASGCTSIYIPVNPRQLADRLPTARAINNIQMLHRLKDAGVYTFTSGIYGVPNLKAPAKTFDDLFLLRDFHIRLLREGYVDASLVFPLSALPGTDWFREIDGNPDFEFEPEHWVGYSIFVPQVYPRELGVRRLWREIIETHRALNELQISLPWFSPFPNRLTLEGADHASTKACGTLNGEVAP